MNQPLLPDLSKVQKALQIDLLQTHDRYFKNLAVAAITSIAFAAVFSLAKMELGAIGKMALGTGALCSAAALFHHKMRTQALEEMGMEDTPETRYTHPIERIIRRFAVTKT